MDKLNPTQRAAMSKMSTERLLIKLGKADFDEQLVAEMTRELLLEAWANCVLSGKDQPSEAAARIPTVEYDVELETQRLEFETKKFEAELAIRQQELEAAKLKEELQEKRHREEFEFMENRRRLEFEAAQRREQREAEDRKALYKLQEQQWEWQQSREVSEAE